MGRNVNELVGKILTNVENTGDEIIFTCEGGDMYKLYHSQDCCESVTVDDVIGDLSDLVGQPITVAEEVSGYTPTDEDGIRKTNEAENYGSCTWTFYRFATQKGHVDIRFFGESNGYYSEDVDFIKVGTDVEY